MPARRVNPPKVKAPTMKTVKTCLSKDAQLDALRSGFKRIPDRRRNGGKIGLVDVLMSGYAVFDLKDPSLLAFDKAVKYAPWPRTAGNFPGNPPVSSPPWTTI